MINKIKKISIFIFTALVFTNVASAQGSNPFIPMSEEERLKEQKIRNIVDNAVIDVENRMLERVDDYINEKLGVIDSGSFNRALSSNTPNSNTDGNSSIEKTFSLPDGDIFIGCINSFAVFKNRQEVSYNVNPQLLKDGQAGKNCSN